MPADPAPFTHHLVGAVHVLTVFQNDPELTRRVLEQERSVCSARRIIVDLSRIGSRLDEHLETLRRLAWNRNLMVRLSADRPPVFLDDVPRSDEASIASAG